MDRQSLAMLIPILALTIPIVAILSNAWLKVAKARAEEARARAGLLEGVDAAEVEGLRDEVARLRGELDELHDRVDFGERLLMQVREGERLPRGEGPPATG